MSREFPAVAKGPSIYEFVRSHLDAAGRLDESLDLPDEDEGASETIRWAPGALDGSYGHHSGSAGLATDRASQVADLVTRACARPSKRRLRSLYAAVADHSPLDYIEPMIERLTEIQPDIERAWSLGHWLATTAPDRGPVKVGLAILGVTGVDDALDVIRTLGAHEEFTLYSAVALQLGLRNPDSELWALAASVHGWGRIECVERLRDTTDAEIRSWILREGFRNSIDYEYLAYIAADTGGLLEALRAPDVDRGLLTAAGEILEALLAGGPAEDIDSYRSGADAVEAYLGLMHARAETLGDFHALTALSRWLRTDGDWEARRGLGWTETTRAVLTTACVEILQRDEWQDRIAVGLLSEDLDEFWRAEKAARARGADTFDIHVGRIETDPFEGFWFQAWFQADRPRAERLAQLARRVLPLDQIATGPTDVMGFGPEWRPHRALDWTLQALPDHIGVGGDLVLVGLTSATTSNREMALNVLRLWPVEKWPTGARELAMRLAASDPNDGIREYAGQILRGEVD
jgi:hypothetical protein